MTVVSSGWIDLKDNVSYSSTMKLSLQTYMSHCVEFYPWFKFSLFFQFRGPFLTTLSNFLGPKAIKLKPVEQ